MNILRRLFSRPAAPPVLSVIELKPDDVLIISVESVLTDQLAERIRDQVLKFLPGRRILVISSTEIKLYAIHVAAEPEAAP